MLHWDHCCTCTDSRLQPTVASSLLPPPSCFVTEFQYCSTWVYNWKITKKSLGPPSPKKERDSQKFESFEFTECERQILGCAMGMVHFPAWISLAIPNFFCNSKFK